MNIFKKYLRLLVSVYGASGIFGAVLGSGIFFSLFFYFVVRSQILSPLLYNSQISATKIPSTKPLIGFLPYWLLDAQIHYPLLDTLMYFDLTFNEDGTIKTREVEDNSPMMGWYKLKDDKTKAIFRMAKTSGVKLGMVFSAFDNGLIDTLLINEKSRQTAILSIVSMVHQYELEAVNIDFEYNTASSVNTKSIENFPLFLQQLRMALDELDPSIEISVDMYANALIKDWPYKVETLHPFVNSIILMAYDFHNINSDFAGSVSPVDSLGTEPSINKALKAAMDKGVPSEKLVLAMPFYGYEWRTSSKKFGAGIYDGSGAVASYKRVNQLIKDEQVELFWDETSKTPYLVYKQSGAIKQIYYDDDKSLGIKLNLIHDLNLGGGAFWALGYDGVDASLWKVVEDWRKGER